MIEDIFIDIGSSGSSNSNEMPYKSYYYKNKLQFVLTKAELESFGIEKGQLIHAISLKSTGQPSRDLTNFRIRIGQTNSDTLTNWVKDNLTLVFQGTVSRVDLVANTTKKYDFSSPYKIEDGNLLIEVSRDETTGANSGSMGTRTGFTNGKMIGWHADRGASFPFDSVAVTPFNYILDVSLTVEKKNYKTSGTYITPIIPKNEPLRIMWTEDKPVGTNIVVEYKGQAESEWLVVENSQTIVGNNDISIRVTLSTDSNDKTPILKNMWLESPTAPQDKILITIDWWSRFNNVEEKIKVEYDASLGNLAGSGGAVESFTREFLPTELVATPNPNAEENISVAPFVFAELKDVEYPKGYGEQGNISVAPFEVTATLINVEDINP